MITDKLYTEVNEDFNKAMMYMHKMPKIWLAYCSFLMRQKKITATRGVFDRALQSLPITQHDMIWDLYIRFVKDCGVLETAACVYRRYILVEPSAVEEFIEWVFARLLTVRYLVAVGKYDEAAVQLCRIINDEKYQSRDGTTKQQLWNELMDILVKHPESITSIRIDSVIRNGIKRFPQEQGRWWCMFAEYYNRLNNNEKARDMWAIPAVLRRSYEEAIQSVSSVRDFSMVYDAYVQSEMRLLEVLMGAEADEAESDEEPLLFGDEDPADADLADLNPEASDLGLRREPAGAPDRRAAGAAEQRAAAAEPARGETVVVPREPVHGPEEGRGEGGGPRARRGGVHGGGEDDRPAEGGGEGVDGVDRVREVLRAVRRPGERVPRVREGGEGGVQERGGAGHRVVRVDRDVPAPRPHRGGLPSGPARHGACARREPCGVGERCKTEA